MKVSLIESAQFRLMVQAGADRLSKNAEYVNSLNVFPVPDGDTGTNMNLSMESGAKAVYESPAEDVGTLASVLSKGLLMGARGNSGVILSQLFRGFSMSVKEQTTLTASELAQAFQAGVETAYQAVMKPVEGTILTVAREAAEAGMIAAQNQEDCLVVMEAVVSGARASLEKTPELLPVLKEVGVVDSGGQGLLFIYEGFYAALSGEMLFEDVYQPTTEEMSEMIHAEHHRSVQSHMATDSITYGYCTEIMVALGEGPTVEEEFDETVFRNTLHEWGDSLLVVADDEVVKVHIHTEYPGNVLNYGQKFGALMKIKVDNMRLQHESLTTASEVVVSQEKDVQEAKQFGLITVAAGRGLQKLFEQLGADYVISGGQTMNPSTEDILTAIEEVGAAYTFILPNNKNIVMAAKQAAEVSDRTVVVIPTETVPQGLTALVSFNDQVSMEDNEAFMTEMVSEVISGQVTRAVRDTIIDGLAIHQDDWLGMVDGRIITATPSQIDTCQETLKQMITADSEIVTIIIGEEGTKKEAKQMMKYLEDHFEDLDIEIHQGDQPVYPYLFAVE